MWHELPHELPQPESQQLFRPKPENQLRRPQPLSHELQVLQLWTGAQQVGAHWRTGWQQDWWQLSWHELWHV